MHWSGWCWCLPGSAVMAMAAAAMAMAAAAMAMAAVVMAMAAAAMEAVEMVAEGETAQQRVARGQEELAKAVVVAVEMVQETLEAG